MPLRWRSQRPKKNQTNPTRMAAEYKRAPSAKPQTNHSQNNQHTQRLGELAGER
jgi:hypothetical protein